MCLQDSILPLNVKWADPDLHNKKRKMLDSDPNSDNTQVRTVSALHACCARL